MWLRRPRESEGKRVTAARYRRTPSNHHRADCNDLAEQARAGDGFQRPLVPRSRCLPRLTRGVDMIDIANGCAKRTYKLTFGATVASIIIIF